MADITKCTGEILTEISHSKNTKGIFICPLRDKCYRFKAPQSEFGQSWFLETPYNREKKECERYICMTEKNKKNNKGL